MESLHLCVTTAFDFRWQNVEKSPAEIPSVRLSGQIWWDGFIIVINRKWENTGGKSVVDMEIDYKAKPVIKS